MAMKPDKVRKLYVAMFLTEKPARVAEGGDASAPVDDARQEVLAVLRRLQTELEKISNLAAEQGDPKTMTAAQDLLSRVVWIKAAINRDLVAYLDSSADLAAAQAMVDDANTSLTDIANGTARAIRRYEQAAPILGAIEKLINFVKAH